MRFLHLFFIAMAVQANAATEFDFSWGNSIFDPSDIRRPGKVLIQHLHPDGTVGQESLGVAVKEGEDLSYLARPFRDFCEGSLRVFDGVNIIPLSPIPRGIKTTDKEYPIWAYRPMGGVLVNSDWAVDLENPTEHSQERWLGACIWDWLPYYEYTEWEGDAIVAVSTGLGVAKGLILPHFFLPPFFTGHILGPVGCIVDGYCLGELTDWKLQRSVGLYSSGQVYNLFLPDEAFVGAVRAAMAL